MATTISAVEGVGPVYSKRLEAAGVSTVESLLIHGAFSRGRRDLALNTGLSESMILDWVNMADLFRIHGIGKQFAELLVQSGVDSVVELAIRNPEKLHRKLHMVNSEKNLTKVVPSLSLVGRFIAEAKTLDKKIYH